MGSSAESNRLLDNYTHEVLFHLVLIAYALVLIYESRAYQYEAALMPRIMSVALILSCLTRLVLILAPTYVPARFSSVGVTPDELAEAQDDNEPGARKVVTILSWIVAYVFIMYVVGLVYGTFLFLVLFSYFWSGSGALTSVLYSLGVAAFIEVVFGRFLRINLYSGIVDLPFF